MAALTNGGSSTLMSSDSSVSIVITSDDGSYKLEKPSFTFSDDIGSDSSGDDVDLNAKQPGVRVLSPETPDFLHSRHSPLLNQLLSTKGQLVKKFLESNETTETRPIHGTTLYIAECKMDVRCFVKAHQIESRNRSDFHGIRTKCIYRE